MSSDNLLEDIFLDTSIPKSWRADNKDRWSIILWIDELNYHFLFF